MTPERLERLAEMADEAADYAAMTECPARWARSMLEAGATARAMAGRDRREQQMMTTTPLCCVCDEPVSDYETNVATNGGSGTVVVFCTCHACLEGR